MEQRRQVRINLPEWKNYGKKSKEPCHHRRWRLWRKSAGGHKNYALKNQRRQGNKRQGADAGAHPWGIVRGDYPAGMSADTGYQH